MRYRLVIDGHIYYHNNLEVVKKSIRDSLLNDINLNIDTIHLYKYPEVEVNVSKLLNEEV